MNRSVVRHTLGWILRAEGFILAVPLLAAVLCRERAAALAVLASAALCLVPGFLLSRKRPADATIYAREGFVVVSLGWLLLSVFGALPFLLSGAVPSFVDALFESASGFSTTGATVLADVESLPRSLLVWRSLTHWIGGMGVLSFLLVFLPLSGGRDMLLYKAESPGPSVSKLVPRLRTTTHILYVVYGVLTALEYLALLLSGMSPFEALNTAFATAGTGGFGIYNDSLARCTPVQQWTVAVFMLLFSVNFGAYYCVALRRFREAVNAELKTFAGIVLAAALLLFLNTRGLFASASEALRHIVFTVASLVSTSGFATTDFDAWPELSRTVLVLLMLVGACAGSTGGGFKVCRVVILVRGAADELLAQARPHRVRHPELDGRRLSPETVRSVNAYTICYVLVFLASFALISVEGHGLVTSFTAVVSALNNIGPGLDGVGPTRNFAFFSAPSKLLLVFDMLAGRLELYPVLALLVPSTWRR